MLKNSRSIFLNFNFNVFYLTFLSFCQLKKNVMTSVHQVFYFYRCRLDFARAAVRDVAPRAVAHRTRAGHAPFRLPRTPTCSICSSPPTGSSGK